MTQAKQLELLDSNVPIEAQFEVDQVEYVGHVPVEYVKVFDESRLSPTAVETKKLLDEWDSELASMSNPLPPIFDHANGLVVARNEMSAFLYENHPDIVEWGLLMPSARALHYTTHLEEPNLPSGQPVGSLMRKFMLETDDGIGIRTRKRVAGKLIGDILRSYDGDASCLSLACGASDLMLEQIAEVEGAHLTLVDIDDLSLNLAERNSQALGLNRSTDYEILDEGQDPDVSDRNVIKSMIRSDSLVQRLGRDSQTVVDAIGINEYFSDALAARFLANAYAMVKPGGVLVTANMLADRPQMNVNRYAIGWTNQVKPRTLEQIVAMIEKAELPLNSTKIFVPSDGVNAVIQVQK